MAHPHFGESITQPAYRKNVKSFLLHGELERKSTVSGPMWKRGEIDEKGLPYYEIAIHFPS